MKVLSTCYLVQGSVVDQFIIVRIVTFYTQRFLDFHVSVFQKFFRKAAVFISFDDS